ESAHPEQSEFVLDTYPIEQDAHNVIIDSLDMKSSNNYFKEANNRLSETNNLLYTDYKKSEAELARRNSREYASQMEIECAKVKGDFLSYKMEYQKSCTQTINDLNQTILEMKDKLSAHQETISILSQQKEAQIKLYKTREDKELDKVIELENKVKVLDKSVYKTGQSVQTMNMLNNKCQTSFAKPEFLKKAQRANPRLYDIGCYNDNLVLMLALESDEVIRLEKESRSKLSDLIRPFDYNKLNNLYDLFIPQREKSSEQRYKWKPKSKKENVNPNVSMPLENASRTANVMDPMTSRHSNVSNTPLFLILLQLVEIVLFIVDSGFSKHMTRNLKLLINFVKKFLGTVKFGNDQIAPILGYGDLVQGAVMIKQEVNMLYS
nr:integrase, catalytic region, zinc finger, CCHC-type, peptidase aspartic, catalytic [Tanacetum cinerariifolium]